MGQEQEAKPVMVMAAFDCRDTLDRGEGVNGDSSAGSRAWLGRWGG